MATVLYVFSATGNSLTTARKLAEQLEDCRIVSAAAVRGQNRIVADAENVGFVFPVYYGDMPWPIRELAARVVIRPDAYVFAFTTCRGHVGAAPQRLDQLLRTRGQRLALAAGIRMPGNSFLNTPEEERASLCAQDAAIREQLAPILRREVRDYAAGDILPLTPVGCPQNFRGITVDKNCIGCGVCVQVCPMGNITIRDGRAVIGDVCATCLACFHWCPRETVWMSRQDEIARRRKYRHPDVTLEDIVALKDR